MILRCAVLLFCLNFVKMSEVIYSSSKDVISEVDDRFSLWPSFHNGVKMMRIRHKREIEISEPAALPVVQPGDQVAAAPSEGSPGGTHAQSPEEPHALSSADSPADNPKDNSAGKPGDKTVENPEVKPVNKPEDKPADASAAETPSQQPENPETPAQNPQQPPATNGIKDNKTPKTEVPGSNPVVNASSPANGTDTKAKLNATAMEPAPKINLSDPGVMKRAVIVFGGFALLGTAYYFVFYRKKNNMNDAKNSHGSIDPNQFRYGVLQSEEKRNNLELSRVPLTMESDEDEDDDLEIFDLGQKKRSLSYINLEQHDDDVVLNDSRSIDMENLLVDIEDKNSEALINWSGSGSKSIL